MPLKSTDLTQTESFHLHKGKKALLKEVGSGLDLTEIVKTLKKDGSAIGFRRLRDLLLERYADVKREFGPVNVINLAINCDKHSMLADVAETRVKDKEDHSKYDQLREYLSGKAPLFTVTPQAEEEIADGQVDESGEEASDDQDDGEPVE